MIVLFHKIVIFFIFLYYIRKKERKKSGKGVVIQNHGGHLLEAMAG